MAIYSLSTLYAYYQLLASRMNFVYRWTWHKREYTVPGSFDTSKIKAFCAPTSGIHILSPSPPARLPALRIPPSPAMWYALTVSIPPTFPDKYLEKMYHIPWIRVRECVWAVCDPALGLMKRKGGQASRCIKLHPQWWMLGGCSCLTFLRGGQVPILGYLLRRLSNFPKLLCKKNIKFDLRL